jgi:hypothetical protein
VAGVAQALGIPLFDDAFNQLTTMPQLVSRVVRRGDGGSLKDWEALGRYIAGACLANAEKPGYLPAEYGADMPVTGRRFLNCTGGCPAN